MRAGRPERQDVRQLPAAGQGIDAGKRIAGRKRLIGVDTLGLLPTVWAAAASVSDNAGGIHLLSHIAKSHPRITKAWADTGYRTKAVDHGAILGIDVEVTRRDPGHKGFKVIPRRWVAERTFGWLMNHRRLPAGAAGIAPLRKPQVVRRRHASFLDTAQRPVEDAEGMRNVDPKAVETAHTRRVSTGRYGGRATSNHSPPPWVTAWHQEQDHSSSSHAVDCTDHRHIARPHTSHSTIGSSHASDGDLNPLQRETSQTPPPKQNTLSVFWPRHLLPCALLGLLHLQDPEDMGACSLACASAGEQCRTPDGRWHGKESEPE